GRWGLRGGAGPAAAPARGGRRGARSPWWPYWRQPRVGAPAGAPQYGWMPPVDWSQVRSFLGATPPQPPPGAQGQWIYRGHRHGRRRWIWIPAPGASSFWWPPAQAADGGGADFQPGGNGEPPAMFPPQAEPPLGGDAGCAGGRAGLGPGGVAYAPGPEAAAANGGEPSVGFGEPPPANGAPAAGGEGG